MKIHIIGGGIGGLSAALHLGKLAERKRLDEQVSIHVYESSDRVGGKSSSQIDEFPGEHGFRFFPGFYRAIVSTLGEIPITQAHANKRGLKPQLAGKTVLQLLTDAPEGSLGMGELKTLKRPRDIKSIPRSIIQFFEIFQIPLVDALRYARILLQFLTSCQERMLQDYENETLDSFFIEKHQMSPEFHTFIRSLRALSAMRASRGSLRSLLYMSTQMVVDFDSDFVGVDSVLPGPTDWMMLEPWKEELDRLGVTFHFHCRVEQLRFVPPGGGATPALASAELIGPDGKRFVITPQGNAEHVILAVPFEVARPLLQEAATHSPLPPDLANSLKIEQRADNFGDGCEPMVGVQFFLRRKSRLPRGHILYCLSKWATTSISQGQFWQPSFERPLSEVFNHPELVDVLSTIVSAWDAPGSRGKSPRESTPSEFIDEVLKQINDGLGSDLAIAAADIIEARIDSDIKYANGQAFCPTPLWVSPRGSYLLRSSPDPGCSNFFIASDWARTETDMGSMESADEAARIAVRAIAERAPLPPLDREIPTVAPLRLWRAVEAAQTVDRTLFRLGLPHLMSVPLSKRKDLVLDLKQQSMSDLQALHAPSTGAHPPEAELIAGDGLAALQHFVATLDDANFDPLAAPSELQLERAAEAMSSVPPQP